MTIQTIELFGERYVIMPEREYLVLTQNPHPSGNGHPEPGVAASPPRFEKVVPLEVPGRPVSEMIIQDRR